MLDDGYDPAGHEAGRAHDLTSARDFGDLDSPSGDQHVDPPTFTRRDDLEAADFVPGVDQDLDSIALHSFTSVEVQWGTSPPSAMRTWPVTKLAASEARKSAGPTISSGWAARRCRLAFAICS
jgi:hypothetical protein